MKRFEIKAEGAGFIKTMGVLIMIVGFIVFLVLIGNSISNDESGMQAGIGIGVLLSSLFIYALTINIANINTNLEKLSYYKKYEINTLEENSLSPEQTEEQKTMEMYNITKSMHGYYLLSGVKHEKLSDAVAHAKKDIENRKH